MNKYLKFGLMIATSTLVMYAMMFFNVFQLDHIFFSETRLYMAFMMGAAMAIIMLLFMWNMYTNKKANMLILLVSLVVFGGSLGLVRSQATIEDSSWLKAMIPHHSIAILTSERAHLSDPRVQELAKKISKAQRDEIKQMKELIEDLENSD